METTPSFDVPAPGVTALEAQAAHPAMVVDLDGTLLKTDLLLESLLALLKQRPLCMFLLPVWLLKGKAYFKQQVARRVELDVSILPYRYEVVDYLERERRTGRCIVLATGCDLRLARQVADHLKIFELVFASDGVTNLAGESKRDRLVSVFGARGFDYAGNSGEDLPVWAAARKAVVVEPGPLLRPRVGRLASVDRVFEHPRRRLLDLARSLRFRHWLKNVLLFVPVLAAHRFFEPALVVQAVLAFLAFGCCASGSYVLNDLLDLASDRHHPDKRRRPFASGDLPIAYGLTLIPMLAGLGTLIALLVSPLFLGVLWIYLALTTTYSLFARKIVLLDVIGLAGLYTMRILAGSAAIVVWPSQWLLAFSTFLFFSLALVKRYGELVIMRRVDGEQAKARGYELGDGELLAAMGTASGYVAVLVLALYVESGTAQSLYGRYELIWLLCPLLLYWISHIWLFAHRGKMPDDPVVFATHDKVSRIVITLMAVVILLAI